jgi:hypothetical protein
VTTARFPSDHGTVDRHGREPAAFGERECVMRLVVSGRFVLDEAAIPPPLKAIVLDQDGSPCIPVGRGVTLRLDPDLAIAPAVLNAKVIIDPKRYEGLGSVVDGCAVLCTSNYCGDWARRNGRPRIVAKIVGVMADEPTYVLLSQPKLKAASRSSHVSKANRIEAGLMPFILIQPGTVECPYCPGPNIGKVIVEP